MSRDCGGLTEHVRTNELRHLAARAAGSAHQPSDNEGRPKSATVFPLLPGRKVKINRPVTRMMARPLTLHDKQTCDLNDKQAPHLDSTSCQPLSPSGAQHGGV
ncbi:hypothetical protein C0Q70_10579 [Pomacea canaliculata]|uniref:Uncharacterized protein n=1 Tax=Pomacea canaliculata TaxID=400727 RepID=A0A2T7P3J7_POMCA|nr:hypothetical protein C0Q70_10579 [Pomacea canaliculata]